MTDFAQSSAASYAQMEREPYAVSTNDMSARGFSEIYGPSAKVEAPSPAVQDQALSERLRTDLLDTQNALESDVAKQGIIGKTYDWLKGHAGTSASSERPLLRAWSEVLNYDDSSTAIEKNLADTAQKLDRFSENPSAASLVQNLQGEIQARADGTAGLKADSMATRYDRSQSAGVNGIADAAVLALSFTKARAASSLLHAGLAGATTKMLLKAVDGAYSTPLDDALSGGLVGVSLHASRVGRSASDSLVTKMENNGFIGNFERRTGLASGPPISMFKGGMEFAPVGALTAVSSSYTSFRADGLNRPNAFGQALEDAPNGAANGFVFGALAGLIRVVPPKGGDSPVPPSTPPSSPLNEGGAARFARQAQEGESTMRTPPSSPPPSPGSEDLGDLAWKTPLTDLDKKLPASPAQGIQVTSAGGAEQKLTVSVDDTITPMPSPEEFRPLDRYVSSMSEAEKLSAAKLKTTSPERLDDLSKVALIDVQKAIAGNIHTSELTLGKLAQHRLASIREVVAANPKTSSEILSSLAHDSDNFVRMAVANNSNSDLTTLRLLKHDSNPTVKHLAYGTCRGMATIRVKGGHLLLGNTN
jgi:hypothetical protein